jgi:phosphoglycolate phosphatase
MSAGKAAIHALPESVRASAYLFDIDGTLMNSRDGVHWNSFHSAVRTVFDVNSGIDGVPIHGNTDVGILRAVLRREGVTDTDFQRELPRMLEHMCDQVRRNAADLRPEVCPSVRELLEALRGEGKLLGVASGNLEPIAWAKLQAAGLRDFFAFGSFSDRHELRPDIFAWGIQEARGLLSTHIDNRLEAASRRDGERCEIKVCIVGDTPSDIEAARKSGAAVIAVATGIYDQATLEACGPDVCVACCTDLLTLF